MSEFVKPKPFKVKGEMTVHPFNVPPHHSKKGAHRERLNKLYVAGKAK